MENGYDATLARLRRICLSLPEVVESVTFGHPTFLAGKRSFVVLDRYKGEHALAFKANPLDQAILVADGRFYVTPYTGKHGWTSLPLTARFEWEEVEALVVASYRLVALKRMLKQLDSAKPD